jgi:uracil-DNA glycosylase family 4
MGNLTGDVPAPRLARITAEIEACRRCPRLVAWREEVASTRRRAYRDQEYWGRGVPGFGDAQARILVVGLAPGAHGSNRTGRMFTGDASGVFLYRALHRAGFANRPTSEKCGDGLVLTDLFITAVCRCAPPDNKPEPQEILNCRPFLRAEVEVLERVQGVVALGRIGFEGILALWKAQGLSIPRLEFAHARLHRLEHGLPWVLTSYHPSQQNTLTGRLTEAMFDEVWSLARASLV